MAYDKEKVAELVKSGRVSKGYTQSELAELTHISIRSIQRIENGIVSPRMYTLRLLTMHLDFDPDSALAHEEFIQDFPKTDEDQKNKKVRRWIISLGCGMVLFFACTAFISQTRNFPETNFEMLTLWGIVCLGYTYFLWRIWK